MQYELIMIPVVGVILIVLRVFRRGSRDTRPSDNSEPSEKLPPFDLAPANVEAPKGRFHEKSAVPVPTAQILVGSAYITDGDTIRIKGTQIRLFGIDAPELNHPYGKKAKWALHGLCKGHTVRAEITEVDHHGRTVARCYLPDGRDLSAEMVKCGLAIDWAKFSGGKYRALETADARRKLFLADARQKGRLDVWERFEAKQRGA